MKLTSGAHILRLDRAIGQQLRPILGRKDMPRWHFSLLIDEICTHEKHDTRDLGHQLLHFPCPPGAEGAPLWFRMAVNGVSDVVYPCCLHGPRIDINYWRRLDDTKRWMVKSKQKEKGDE